MKLLNISELSERITLVGVVETLDAELNRIESLKDVATVWAKVEPKSSAYDGTPTGERAEVRYKVTIRKNPTEFTYIRWRGEVYNMLAPKYDVESRYTVFEMVGGIHE